MARANYSNSRLKGKFTEKLIFTHYLLTSMPMEGWVKCLSPQNMVHDKTTEKAVVCSCGVIQVSASPDIQTRSFTPCFWPKSPREVAKLADLVNDILLSLLWMPGLVDTWMTPHKQHGGVWCFFSAVLLRLKKDSPLTLIVLDSAAIKFTPETPEVFCGFKPPPR